MSERSIRTVNEILNAYPTIDVARDRDGSVMVFTPQSRFRLSLFKETAEQQKPSVAITVLSPDEREVKRLAHVHIHPTPKGVKIESESEQAKIDPQRIIRTATQGLELFETAKEAGFRHFPVHRVCDGMRPGDDDHTRISLMNRAAEAREAGRLAPESKPWDLPSRASKYMLEVLKSVRK